jgi:hypothetical protein
MDNVACPGCSSPALRMPVLSYVSRADNYYCCTSCGQVSHMPKDASSGLVILQRARESSTPPQPTPY